MSALHNTKQKSLSLIEISAEFSRAYGQSQTRTLPIDSVEGTLDMLMQQYDTDQSGTFSSPEIKAIVSEPS